MREAGSTYFSDVLTLVQRCMDVLFYDIQMVASVVHSNRMLEGMTQVCLSAHACVCVSQHGADSCYRILVQQQTAKMRQQILTPASSVASVTHGAGRHLHAWTKLPRTAN